MINDVALRVNVVSQQMNANVTILDSAANKR
jgi:hypothetical protein